MPKDHSQTHTCPICLHDYAESETNKHHLTPVSRGGKETARLCRMCHKQIHATFSEKELEREYASIESLLAAKEFQGWIRWARKRKLRRMKTARHHRRRR